MSIQLWKEEDREVLTPMMKEYLENQYSRNLGDIKPTDHNVNALVSAGMLAAENGDPCCALWKDNKIVGFTLWVNMPSQGLDIREKICLGLGTFIAKEYRRKGLSNELQTEALRIAKEAGYARVDGAVGEKVGDGAAKKVGGKYTYIIVTRRL